jgi:hypothetical protein
MFALQAIQLLFFLKTYVSWLTKKAGCSIYYGEFDPGSG